MDWRYLLLVVTACGRVNFGPWPDTGATDASSSIDDSTSADADLNGDGPNGDGPPAAACTTGDHRVSPLPTFSYITGFASSGSNFGFVWGDPAGTLHFVQTDFAGVGSIQMLGTYNSTYSVDADLLWTGSEWAVVWHDGGTLWFARLDAAGNEIGTEGAALSGGFEADLDLVTPGSGYVLNWYQYDAGDPQEYISLLDTAGANTSGPLLLTGSGQSYGSTITWNGTDYALAYYHYNTGPGTTEIDFQRIGANGTPIGGSRRLTDVASVPEVVWNGTGYAIAWIDSRDGNNEIYFGLFDAAGQQSGTSLRVTNDPGPSINVSLVWTGTEYGVAWSDRRNSNTDIYFRRLDSAGMPLGTELRVTTDLASSDITFLTWNGTWYTVAYRDTRDGQDEVYFTSLCP